MDIASGSISEGEQLPKNKVPALKKPLIYLARQYAKIYPRPIFTAVTGSLGTATCVKAAAAILSQKFKTISTDYYSNSIIRIPQTILRINPSVKKVILEMNVEHKGELDFYLSLIRPQTVVVTRIAFAKSEFLGSPEEVLEEQVKLVEQLDENGVAILNFDDPYSRKLAKKCKGTVIFFGTDPENCTIWAGNIKIENFRTTFELNLGVERAKVNFPLLGIHKVYSALAAATLGVVSNIALTKIKLALETLPQEEHQMQTLAGPNDSIILDDTYNSAPADLEAAIDILLQMSARRRVLVLGEMKNLGKYSEMLHRQIAQKVFKEKIDLIFLGQGDTQFIGAELKDLGFWEERVDSNLQNSQLVNRLLKNLGKGDLVLIKGSPGARLDEVVKRISKKL